MPGAIRHRNRYSGLKRSAHRGRRSWWVKDGGRRYSPNLPVACGCSRPRRAAYTAMVTLVAWRVVALSFVGRLVSACTDWTTFTGGRRRY